MKVDVNNEQICGTALFQKHAEGVRRLGDAIIRQKEKISRREEADCAFEQKFGKTPPQGELRQMYTILWGMESEFADMVDRAESELSDMDDIRKIWKIRDETRARVRAC